MSDTYSRRSESISSAAHEIENAALAAGTRNTVTVRLRQLPEREPNRIELQVTITPAITLPFYQLSLRRTYEWLRIAHHLPSGLPATSLAHGDESYRFEGASLCGSKPGAPFALTRLRDGKRLWCSADFVRSNFSTSTRTDESIAGVFSLGVGEGEIIFS